MTKSQTIYYFQLWNLACKAQGWTTKKGFSTAQINGLRKKVHQEVFGRELSSKDIDHLGMFDLIKKRLKELADDIEIREQPKHRTLWFIQHDILPRLGLYVADVDAYVQGILQDRFRLFRGCATLEDLSAESRWSGGEEKPSQLEMMKFTLNRAVDQLRQSAGHSVHDMRTRAGLKCDCSACRTGHVTAPVAAPGNSAEPVYAGPPEGQPF